MKVLVTGGCGFLGSHVCEYYIKKGWEVISFDNMTKFELERTGFATEEARLHNNKYLDKIGVSLVTDDVRNLGSLLDNSSGCDYIVHTAAQPAMTISWEDPLMDLHTNITGTVNVLEAARKHKIPVATCASGHVYGNAINLELEEGEDAYVRKPVGVDENYPTLGGTLTPLHASKAAGDIYVKVYNHTYNLDACSFRLSGIYGTRQFGGEDHGWIANFSIRAAMGWPLTIFGTGKQVRDIVYAQDVCEAFHAFYETRSRGVFNIGGGSKAMLSLINAIELIEKINGRKANVIYDKDRHGDLRYFVCELMKAKAELGWEPKVMPEEGIGLLMDWVNENKNIFSMKD